MRKREDFHEILVNSLDTRNVYFQPPESLKMHYPCIRYSINTKWKINADNKKYAGMNRYTVIYMKDDPDEDEVTSKLEDIEYSNFDRSYPSDGVNHFVYTIYY